MKRHVVVLGAGFAGVQAAIELSKQDRFSVTLVSDRDYLFLYPTSIWIPVHGTTFEKTSVPLEEIRRVHGFSLIVEPVRSIRSAENIVETERGTIPYDYLIVALGADKMTHPGIEHTTTICGKPEMTLEVRNRLDALVAKGAGRIAVGFGGNPKDVSAVRGGPAFEFLFNVDRYLRTHGIREKFELSFFAPMANPGIRMGEGAVKMVDAKFAALKIAKRYGKKITAFRPDGVTFEDGSTLDADLVMFIPGNAGHTVMKHSDLPLNEAGFVKIDDAGLVEGTANVYAAGDVAAIEGPEWRAKQGHITEVMARNAAANIIAQEEGRPEREGYRKHLNILCVMDTGDGAAIVFRDARRQWLIPLPVVGHWMKKAWGWYARATKTGRMVRLPGL